MTKRKISTLATTMVFISTAAIASVSTSVSSSVATGEKTPIYFEGVIQQVKDDNTIVIKEYVLQRELEVHYDDQYYPIQPDGTTLPPMEGETIAVEGQLHDNLFASEIVAKRIEYVSPSNPPYSLLFLSFY